MAILDNPHAALRLIDVSRKSWGYHYRLYSCDDLREDNSGHEDAMNYFCNDLSDPQSAHECMQELLGYASAKEAYKLKGCGDPERRQQ